MTAQHNQATITSFGSFYTELCNTLQTELNSERWKCWEKNHIKSFRQLQDGHSVIKATIASYDMFYTHSEAVNTENDEKSSQVESVSE